MTRRLSERLRELAGRATGGPWSDGMAGGTGIVKFDGDDIRPVVIDPSMKKEDRALICLLVNSLPEIEAALALAEDYARNGGEWAGLSEDGECCTCGATIADADGEPTLPHRSDCSLASYRSVAAKEEA